MKLKELKPEKCLEGLLFNKIVTKGIRTKAREMLRGTFI